MNKQIKTANVASFCTALILFLFPWTNVTCGGQKLATQSGLQAVYGGASAAAGMDKNQNTKVHDSDLPVAALVAIALFVVIAGAVITLLVFLNRPAPAVEPGIISLAALGLLAIQAIIGFPIDKLVKQQAGGGSNADDMDRAMRQAMESAIGVERTPWFWFAIVALAVPAAIWLKARLAKPAAAAAPAAPPPPA